LKLNWLILHAGLVCHAWEKLIHQQSKEDKCLCLKNNLRANIVDVLQITILKLKNFDDFEFVQQFVNVKKLFVYNPPLNSKYLLNNVSVVVTNDPTILDGYNFDHVILRKLSRIEKSTKFVAKRLTLEHVDFSLLENLDVECELLHFKNCEFDDEQFEYDNVIFENCIFSDRNMTKHKNVEVINLRGSVKFENAELLTIRNTRNLDFLGKSSANKIQIFDDDLHSEKINTLSKRIAKKKEISIGYFKNMTNLTHFVNSLILLNTRMIVRLHVDYRACKHSSDAFSKLVASFKKLSKIDLFIL